MSALFPSTGGTYTDHGFRIRRSSPSHLANHFKIQQTAHPDFAMSLDPASPIYYHATSDGGRIRHEQRQSEFPDDQQGGRLRTICRGIRPRAGSGALDLVVRHGTIERCDEWYDWSARTEMGVAGNGDEATEVKTWEAWVPEDGYHVLGEGDFDQRTLDKA
ncbi:uncharacterized protein HMPREF1541_05042 [Cyphellophora europaea CBS 101466]|uniref:Uncharacterized protein n=1 Tax=Cyphellophora europaea (strain CBS 101466) TaxID=1220924 RepID=W2RWE1_CYPE1|nr:uncharacterized protein HMPREF1541_05042 [Cyphellophora europaea CBS 101466]ETN40762.1 hypothetical protein HMPREF1541_05042 [Cyphellophora europaea CBS 101466]